MRTTHARQNHTGNKVQNKTEETHVVYKALYGERGVWVRALALFDDEVRREGKEQKRFVLLENQEPC